MRVKFHFVQITPDKCPFPTCFCSKVTIFDEAYCLLSLMSPHKPEAAGLYYIVLIMNIRVFINGKDAPIKFQT